MQKERDRGRDRELVRDIRDRGNQRQRGKQRKETEGKATGRKKRSTGERT